MRGEHYALPSVWKPLPGSSPHARGAHVSRTQSRFPQGIIPACAGSTLRWTWTNRRPWDHPRMRGEHCGTFRHLRAAMGSSPHARGARRYVLGVHYRRGIIPACAGSTTTRIRACPRRRDHPRMRGEHSVSIELMYVVEGSSPHARGAPVGVDDLVRRGGIIPACAGSTRSERSAWSRWRDHPRMRGEHLKVDQKALDKWGSSPHARGALVDAALGVHAYGIIPACAGSTSRRPASRPPRRDHPRMRGEHANIYMPLWYPPGSSPHARGAR